MNNCSELLDRLVGIDPEPRRIFKFGRLKIVEGGVFPVRKPYSRVWIYWDEDRVVTVYQTVYKDWRNWDKSVSQEVEQALNQALLSTNLDIGHC